MKSLYSIIIKINNNIKNNRLRQLEFKTKQKLNTIINNKLNSSKLNLLKKILNWI